MKKIIRKFWGVGLVLILLSTLLVGALPQASAANYAFSADLTQPTVFNWILNVAGSEFLDVSQSGSTIYAVSNSTAAGNFLYKSVTGGATWFTCVALGIPNAATDNWCKVATAPDDPNWVVVVNNPVAGGDAVYASRDGGATFELLVGAVSIVINDVTISHDVGVRYIVVCGNDAVAAGTAGTIDSWMVGPIAPVWTNISTMAGSANDTIAAQFTTNFPADSGLVVVNTNSANTTDVEAWVYSYNLLQWNPAGYGFPRVLEVDSAAGAITCPRAEIALDANFYLGDVTSQIGFIGTSIIDSALGEIGGVYRFDLSPLTGWLTQIYVGAINSVAWDGSNLMAGVLAAGPVVVQRSANALGPLPSFLPNSPFKTPGTGTFPLVLFNGGVGYCFSRGTNSAVARTTDYGATFDGIALVNSTFALVVDWWLSPDCTTMYVITDDGVDINLWKKAGSTWERVFILAAAGGAAAPYMVRADDENPDTVFIGLQGGVIVYKSLDGAATWVTRAFASNMQDFVVQDANTLYMAVQGAATVRKSDSGAFLWYLPVSTTLNLFFDTCYSLNLIADDQLIVGGNAGTVAYSTDGNTSWTLIFAVLGPAAGNGGVVATANGLATGNTIWAGDNAVGNLCSWTIGVNTPLTGWTTSVAKTANGATTIDGINLTNDILYAWDDGNCVLYRFLYPTLVMVWETDYIAANGTITSALAGTTINALQCCSPSSNIWIRDAAATDTMQSYTSNLHGANMAPVPTYPINDTIIPVNSINGAVLGYNFQWTAPMGSYLLGYLFDIQIYLDAGMTILVGQDLAIGLALFDGGVGSVPSLLTGGAAPAFGPVPGETYYWRVRVAAGNPVESYWSPLQTFSIEQLVAIVPVIASPMNGTEVNTTSPGFSWSPITGATSYRFELAEDTNFTELVYTADTASAGLSLPSDITLERGKQYFWRVKTLTPNEGDWSAVGNFIVAELPPETSPPVTLTTAPTPTITAVISQPAATTTVITVPPAEEKVVNPSYIWAIIVVGAVLVIAVIILIVRTRRTV